MDRWRKVCLGCYHFELFFHAGSILLIESYQYGLVRFANNECLQVGWMCFTQKQCLRTYKEKDKKMPHKDPSEQFGSRNIESGQELRKKFLEKASRGICHKEIT